VMAACRFGGYAELVSVSEDDTSFLPQAEAALAAFAARPGFVRGRIGRAADDPTAWILSTEWEGVGAYRRSLSSYDVKVDAAPLLGRGHDEPNAFEVLRAVDLAMPVTVTPSSRAAAPAPRDLRHAADMRPQA